MKTPPTCGASVRFSRHYGYDANGNTMGLTSDTGTVLARYRYHPFGTLESSGGSADWLSWNRFTFSTKWHDPTTGLHYYGHRWYDPVAGRWPSRDPLGDEAFLQAYVQRRFWEADKDQIKHEVKLLRDETVMMKA